MTTGDRLLPIPHSDTSTTNNQAVASQGTRSTRRRAREILKRLSGRERRYQAWLNHNISQAIIAEAVETGSFLAIEEFNRYSRKNQS